MKRIVIIPAYNEIESIVSTVEDIRDSVENVLIQAGYGDVAKAYILYRQQ